MSGEHTHAPTCDFCGLPLPRATFFGRAPTEEPVGAQYCCFGCRFASSVVNERGQAGAVSWTLVRLGLSIFFTMNVMVFTMVLWSRDVYAIEGVDRVGDSFAVVFRYLGLLFSLPVLVFLGGPILDEAWKGLKRRVLTTDLLIAAGVAAAYVASAVTVFRGGEHVYFEVGCVVLVFISLGRWLEATAKMKAVAALDSLEKLLPTHVRLVTDEGERVVTLHEAASGNIVRVGPGERFPVDGRIVRGETTVDEQLFTGESWPLGRGYGDSVLGGTLNVDGSVDVAVTASAAQGTFARLVAAVRGARETRTRYETLAATTAAWFVPAVIVISLFTLTVHWVGRGFEPALMASLSVVLIACPCALGLATPLAVWCALGRATREHILFRNGDAIERLAVVRAIRFDKTGTLTTGLPRVSRLVCEDDGQRREVESISAAIARLSTHSYSRAIVDFTGSAILKLELQDVEQHPGRGCSAVLVDDNFVVMLGSRRLLDDSGWTIPEKLLRAAEVAERAGQPFSCVGWNGRTRAVFEFQETLRPEAVETIEWFRQARFDIAALTGDHRERGKCLSRNLGIPVEAGLLPDDKAQSIRRTQEQLGPTAFVGDGINDAPALVASDVGIAMGCGTDITRETADVCLLGNNLASLPWLVELSRFTRRTIRWNLFWAFGYNSLGVAAAACGLLYPALAALLMIVSSVFVVANSLRIQGFPAIGSHTADASNCLTNVTSAGLDEHDVHAAAIGSNVESAIAANPSAVDDTKAVLA